ncbi:MAG TPA: hypothetical protein H9732_05465 [Candidatus Mediterraneibacter avicola]|nr:hypothetical protein [Candidatus Mediterraneibacter avicola]
MKKRITLLFITFLLGAALSACGNDVEEKQGNESTDGTARVVETTVYPSETTLADLEAYLLENGVLAGERTEVNAEKVGALEGFSYPDSNVEIYEYDMDSFPYDSLATGGCVGFTYAETDTTPAETGGPFSAEAVNRQYVMIATGDVSGELRNTFGNFDR